MAGRRRKPGECLCPCHQNGMTILGGPCAWCRDLHPGRAAQVAETGGSTAGPAGAHIDGQVTDA